RPPTPTLFPYTTLFRSPRCDHDTSEAPSPFQQIALRSRAGQRVLQRVDSQRGLAGLPRAAGRWPRFAAGRQEALRFPADVERDRSEEHTSELQSRFDLV